MRLAIVLTGDPLERALDELSAPLARQPYVVCRRGEPAERDAVGEPFDVAVAGSWQGALALPEVPARCRVRLVSALEDRRWLPDAPERRAAAAALALPLAWVATNGAVVSELENAFPARRARLVRRGVPRELTAAAEPPRPALDEPLHVVVHGDPADAADNVAEALAALRAMRAPKVVTTVAPGAAPHERAAAYRAGHVVLDLRRCADPAELAAAFAAGATCLATPSAEHVEIVADGANGLLTSWDDQRGAARLLDLLARDRRLLHELRRGAWETGRQWPTTEQAASLFGLALGRIAASRADDAGGDLASRVAVIRQELDHRTVEGSPAPSQPAAFERRRVRRRTLRHGRMA